MRNTTSNICKLVKISIKIIDRQWEKNTWRNRNPTKEVIVIPF